MRARYVALFFISIAVAASAPAGALAATDVANDITSNTEWTIGGSPYVVSGNPFNNAITIAPNVTLTIAPGVIVKFAEYNGMTVNGVLNAVGAKDSPIIFTSLEDDSAGGDTNGDGTDTTPTDRQWRHLRFNAGSNGTFDYTVVRYGGGSQLVAPMTGIANYGGTVTVNHTTLAHNGYDGLGQYSGHTTISNSLISDHTVGINMRGGVLEVTNSSIRDNSDGIDNRSQSTVAASNNWWGDAGGPYEELGNPTSIGNAVYGNVIYSPWLTSDPFAQSDPCVATNTCVSNVLFLPGIEASRLYRPDYDGGTDQLWEPNIDGDVQDLYMNADGNSTRFDVYAKEGDVIDELPDGENIYKSFIGKMNDLKTNSIINDWEPVAYDWRLSLDDILNYGNDVDGRIYYSGDLRATSTPYVIQELKHLAATSKTGKVTIVAHSNGGLLAKRLIEILGSTEAARLIDKMIFVAVPQAGTPMAIPAGLHGYEQDHVLGLVTSKSTARTFAVNSPMEYQLLPSSRYFTQVDDPVVTFDTSLPDWIARYGTSIHSQELLHTFLTDTFGRVDPQTGDINQPTQLNDPLLSSAETLHTSLDTWAPPSGVQLIQIAGWGVPKTVEGIMYKKKGTGVTPEPQFTVDGDGTVVVPSALWTSTATGVENYWMNLRSYNSDHLIGSGFGFSSFDHSRILESTQLLDFLSNQITNTTKPLSDYVYLSTEAPADSERRLRYALHSPLTLNLYDDQGRHTGVSTSTGQIEEQIPGTYYTEFGDVKYLFTDASSPAHVLMDGYAAGTFDFNVDQYSVDTLTASTTFKDIPTTPDTNVSLDIQSDISTLSPMNIDKDGDGTIDTILAPKLNDTVTLDIIPPEIQIAFSTTTKSILFTGTDDSGSATMTSTTTYPALKKNQKEYKGIATTTVTASDEAGNTTKLVYTEQLPSPNQRDVIIPRTLVYNGATTTLSSTVVSYKWRVNKNGSFNIFASHLRGASSTLESHYRPKKNKTIIMAKPQDLDDSDDDDNSDVRPAKQTISGMVIPYVATEKGSLIINY